MNDTLPDAVTRQMEEYGDACARRGGVSLKDMRNDPGTHAERASLVSAILDYARKERERGVAAAAATLYDAPELARVPSKQIDPVYERIRALSSAPPSPGERGATGEARPTPRCKSCGQDLIAGLHYATLHDPRRDVSCRECARIMNGVCTEVGSEVADVDVRFDPDTCGYFYPRPAPSRSEELPPPTHRCKTCGALWILNPPSSAQPDGSWSLWSKRCGQCCDNVEMGEQIEAISDWRPLCDPGPMGEPSRSERTEDAPSECADGHDWRPGRLLPTSTADILDYDEEWCGRCGARFSEAESYSDEPAPSSPQTTPAKGNDRG